MIFLYKIVAVIYRTYDKKGAHSPYFDAILTIIFILFLHAVHIGLIFKMPSSYIIPWSSEGSRASQWVFGTVYFLTLLAVVAVIFKKSRIQKIPVSQIAIDRARRWIPIYMRCCILLLAVLLIKSGIERGKI